MEKKLDGNYIKRLRVILNKSRRLHLTKQQLYGRIPPLTKTIKIRRTRHAGHFWRSRDELISDILLWILSQGRAKAGWTAQTYIQQLCADTECSSEDLPEAMDYREGWRERVRDIRADGVTWWWWWLKDSIYLKRFCLYNYVQIILCYYNFLWVFHTSSVWLFSLKSKWLQMYSTRLPSILWSVQPRSFLWSPIPLVSIPDLKGSFQGYQL